MAISPEFTDGDRAVIEAIKELQVSIDQANERRTRERQNDRKAAGGSGDVRTSAFGDEQVNQLGDKIGRSVTDGINVQTASLAVGFNSMTGAVDGLTKNFKKESSDLIRTVDSKFRLLAETIPDRFTDFATSPTGALAMASGNPGIIAGAFAAENADLMADLGEFFFNEIIPGIQNILFSVSEMFLTVAEGLQTMLNSLVKDYFEKTRALVLLVQETEADLERTLGISRDLVRTNRAAFNETRAFLGEKGIQQATKAFENLFNTFTDFTFATQLQQQRLIEVGATLDHLGYSADNFAKGIQLLTKALGKSEEAAAQTQLSLTALAMDIGVSPEKMAQDFIGAGDAVAKLGSQGEVAFRRLAIAAKITGIEVGRLLQMTEKFDTFDGAAEQAGKLNAALGGNFVNAMDLMTATDPVERFNMIRDSIKNAGLSFDTMSYYQKNFYKDSLGLNDVGELANMLSGNMDSLNNQLGKTSAEYSEMAKRAARVRKIQEIINTIFHSFLETLDPLIDGIQEFTVKLSEGMFKAGQNLNKFKKAFIAITLGMSAFVFVASEALAALSAILAIVTLLIPGGQPLSAIFSGLAIVFSSFGVAVGGVASGAGGLAVAFTATGGAAKALTGVVDVVLDFFDRLYKAFDSIIVSTPYMTDLLDQLSGDKGWGGYAMILEKVLDVVLDVAKAFFKFAEPFVYLGVQVLEFVDTLVQAYEVFQNLKKSSPLIASAISAILLPFTSAFAILKFIATFNIKAVFLPFIIFFKSIRTGAQALGLLFDALEAVFASLFSTPRNPPNAFQGLIQLVEIFTNFGSAIFNLETPLKFITGVMDVMFKTIFSSFGLLKDAFALLIELAQSDLTSVGETFDSVSDAANSLNKISLAKMAMLTAGSTANSLAQSVDGVSKAVTAMSGGDNERPLQIHVRIDLDGGKFADKVINITSREIERLRRDG
jgi:hypothetical protein